MLSYWYFSRRTKFVQFNMSSKDFYLFNALNNQPLYQIYMQSFKLQATPNNQRNDP